MLGATNKSWDIQILGYPNLGHASSKCIYRTYWPTIIYFPRLKCIDGHPKRTRLLDKCSAGRTSAGMKNFVGKFSQAQFIGGRSSNNYLELLKSLILPRLAMSKLCDIYFLLGHYSCDVSQKRYLKSF